LFKSGKNLGLSAILQNACRKILQNLA